MAISAPRYSTMKPYTWPQDTLRIPDNGGGRFMPPVELGNIQVARQESFMMSATFNLAATTPAGTQVVTTIPTDQDGDFWAEQIYLCCWQPVSTVSPVRPPVSTLAISDLRTGKNLTYPDPIPTNFLTTIPVFVFDGASVDVTVNNSPPPSGFRSTSVLGQPFCFTRQGGIQLTLTVPIIAPYPNPITIDIAFAGWKEYTYAST